MQGGVAALFTATCSRSSINLQNASNFHRGSLEHCDLSITRLRIPGLPPKSEKFIGEHVVSAYKRLLSFPPNHTRQNKIQNEVEKTKVIPKRKNVDETLHRSASSSQVWQAWTEDSQKLTHTLWKITSTKKDTSEKIQLTDARRNDETCNNLK